VTLWDAATHKSDQIDSALKSNLTFLSWSKTSMLLAVGMYDVSLNVRECSSLSTP
jgi:hypothetical protein